MDPKSIANLDPKLRETYERVMGSNPSPAAPAPSAEVTQPSPTQPSPTSPELSATPQPTVAPPPDLSAPVSPEPQLSATPPGLSLPTDMSGTSGFGATDPNLSLATPPGPETPTMQPLASPASVAQASEGANNTIKLLYILGGVVFFIVYVFFWIKIFNYQLPF